MKTNVPLVLVSLILSSNAIAQKNSIKTSLTNLALNTYTLTYERAISSRLALQASLDYMPDWSPWFSQSLPDLDNMPHYQNNFSMGARTATLDFKIYMQEAMSGGYIAPYFRYSQHSMATQSVPFTYKDSLGTARQAPVDYHVDINRFSLGVYWGYQWIIKERLAIDLWIVGVSFTSDQMHMQVSSEHLPKDQFQAGSSLDDHVNNLISGWDITSKGNNEMSYAKSQNFIGGRGLGLNIGWAF
jgi:hypothetical protein